jgi:hypothetical protein
MLKNEPNIGARTYSAVFPQKMVILRRAQYSLSFRKNQHLLSVWLNGKVHASGAG